jgi:hypothetical protein
MQSYHSRSFAVMIAHAPQWPLKPPKNTSEKIPQMLPLHQWNGEKGTENKEISALPAGV